MTVQYTYVFGEAVANWNDIAPTVQTQYLFSEIVAPIAVVGPNSTVFSLWLEVIHDLTALPAPTSVPILIACT